MSRPITEPAGAYDELANLEYAVRFLADTISGLPDDESISMVQRFGIAGMLRAVAGRLDEIGDAVMGMRPAKGDEVQS